MFETKQLKETCPLFWSFEFWKFGTVSDLDIRISYYAYALNSAQTWLGGWDIPEAAYVASLCLLKEPTLPK
jgi:hypothetical protein